MALYLFGPVLLAGFAASGALRQFIGLVCLLFAFLAFTAWMVWDAARLVRRTGDYPLRRYNRWYVYVGAWLLSAFLIAPRLLALSPVRSFWIPSASMEPTLLVGDHLVADLRYYRSARPARGDIALMSSPENPAVLVTERLIGLAGEEIEIRDKKIFLNGRPLPDPWGRHGDSRVYPASSPLGRRDNFGPLKIPAGMLFVLGDNRDYSYDSRFYGLVPAASLKGRALYLYWARDKSRIGRPLR
jgi:signal peptidase I